MVAAVAPEEFGVSENVGVYGGVDLRFFRDQSFEQCFLAESEAGELVENNRVDGDGGLVQPVGEGLLFGCQAVEAFGFELQESRVVDAFDERGSRGCGVCGAGGEQAKGE